MEQILLELQKKYRLGIVSDAWPSLISVYNFADLKNYFSSFVISSFIGTTKPDERMYKAALEELELLPSEVVFVDDNIKNCNGAKKVGIQDTFLLCRDFKVFVYYKLTCKDHTVISDLKQMVRRLEK